MAWGFVSPMARGDGLTTWSGELQVPREVPDEGALAEGPARGRRLCPA